MSSIPLSPLRTIVEPTGYHIADDATYLSQADTKEIVESLHDYAACSYEETLAEIALVDKMDKLGCWLRSDWWRFVRHVHTTVYHGKPQSRGKAVRRACREYRLDLA